MLHTTRPCTHSSEVGLHAKKGATFIASFLLLPKVLNEDGWEEKTILSKIS